MTNRYTELSFNSLKDLPMLSLPYDALNDMLGQNQANILATDSMTSMAPKFIQESVFATDAAKQINQYQQQTKEKLAQIAATGNTRDYMAALDQTQQEIAKLYRPGGLAYNLEQDYAKYTQHVAKEQERLSKGEIDQYQFQQSIKNPLQQYDAAKGTKQYNPTLKPQAVNFDEFANKFIANYKDTDLVRKGNFRIINGQVVYDDTKVTGVEAQKVLRDLSDAFESAASTTGQLQDRFNVLNEGNKLVTDYKSKQLQDSSNLLNLLTNSDLTKKSNIESIQKQLNQLGLDAGGVDGKIGPKTKAAIELAKKSAQATIEGLNQTDDSALVPEAQQDFYSNYVKGLATPYASATGRQKEERKFTNFGDTLGRFKEEEDYKAKKKAEEEANKTAIVQILPANKAVPKDVQYYVKDGKLKKNTNTSADARDVEGKVFGFMPGYELGNSVISFFDRLFTSNDTADFSDPVLGNIREHMASANPAFNSLPQEQQMEAVAKEIDRQSKESLGGTFTANTSSKLKENYDKIFGAITYNKDGEIEYDPGLLPNFKIITREGKVESGQNFLNEVKDGKYGKEAGLSYKGTVDDVYSPLPYGTTIMGVGDTEVHIEPDVQSTYSNEALLNGVYRSMINAEIGNTSNFKYKGTDFTSTYKPDGTVVLTDKQSKQSVSYQPSYNEAGQLIGLKQK